MKVLFIWDGNEISDFRNECIERAMEIYPLAEWVCISKGGWPYRNFELVSWDEIKRKILTRYGMGVDLTIPFSDYARFVYLSENPYTLYLDTDIYCIKAIPGGDKVGYYKADICALWSGNDVISFHRAVLNRKAKNILPECVTFLPRDSFDLKPYCQHKGEIPHAGI